MGSYRRRPTNRFAPCSPMSFYAQVQRLSMQRRIFRIDGKPFVATRDGGAFLETHATLLPLIGG